MTFGEWLTRVREKYGLSVAQFLEGMNQHLPAGERYTLMMIYNWSRDIHRPRITMLYWIVSHAPAGSWQYEFAERGMQIIADTTASATLPE